MRFETAPLPEDLEIVGPVLLRLYVSSSVTDADLFVAVRELRPDGTEVTVQGAQDGHICPPRRRAFHQRWRTRALRRCACWQRIGAHRISDRVLYSAGSQ